MLRPDFTVPIVRLHMDGAPAASSQPIGGAAPSRPIGGAAPSRPIGAAAPARYAYAGPVWRRQEPGSGRPTEYLQAGIELFDGTDPAQADAEVFALIADAVALPGVEPATGDMGLILAAIDALPTTDARKRALRRHVWRPHAFRRLLDRFGRHQKALIARRAEMIAAWRAGAAPDLIAAAGAPVGLRSPEDIDRRLARIAEEAETPPLTPDEVRGLEAVLAVRGSAAEALGTLRHLTRTMPALEPAVDRLAARLDALKGAGHPAEALPFEATFGRTTLEYYDGFVFGFRAANRPDHPPLASGGRYDALTRILGDRPVPAVGGMVRPEALLALEEEP